MLVFRTSIATIHSQASKMSSIDCKKVCNTTLASRIYILIRDLWV